MTKNYGFIHIEYDFTSETPEEGEQRFKRLREQIYKLGFNEPRINSSIINEDFWQEED